MVINLTIASIQLVRVAFVIDQRILTKDSHSHSSSCDQHDYSRCRRSHYSRDKSRKDTRYSPRRIQIKILLQAKKNTGIPTFSLGSMTGLAKGPQKKKFVKR